MIEIQSTCTSCGNRAEPGTGQELLLLLPADADGGPDRDRRARSAPRARCASRAAGPRSAKVDRRMAALLEAEERVPDAP